MTREEAKSFKWFQSDRTDIYLHIDKIFYDFESRTCESCIDYRAKWRKVEMNNASLHADMRKLERKVKHLIGLLKESK